MKTFQRWLLMTIAALAQTQPTSAATPAPDSVNLFYDALKPHGEWIHVDDYDYCWRPAVGVQDENWRPYCFGSWVFTEAGWTWLSDEPWGWATYHFGRWMIADHHWCWVPGAEWAPAWVSFRQTEDYVGWAPLPPEAKWNPHIGFNSAVDGCFDIGPDCFNFVPARRFGAPHLQDVIVNPTRTVSLIQHSMNITRISFRDDVPHRVFVAGPDFIRLQGLSATKIRRLSLRLEERRDEPNQLPRTNEDEAGRNKLQPVTENRNGEFLASIPRQHAGTEVTGSIPREVAVRLDRSAVDRGWQRAASANAEAVENLRRRLREELQEGLRTASPAPTEPPVVASESPSPSGTTTASSKQPQSAKKGTAGSKKKTPEKQPVAATSRQPSPVPRFSYTGNVKSPSDLNARQRSNSALVMERTPLETRAPK